MVTMLDTTSTSRIRPILIDAVTQRAHVRDKVLTGLQESFPLESRNYNVHVENMRVIPAEFSSREQKNAILAGRSLSERVVGDVKVLNKSGDEVSRANNFTLMHLPWFTQRHTFIIDGNDYNLSNQVRTKPGVYTRRRGNDELEASFNLSKGRNFRLSMAPETGRVFMEYGTTAVPLYPLLRAMNVPHADVVRHWGQEIADINAKDDRAARQTVDKLYGKLARNPEAASTPEGRRDTVLRALQDTAMDADVNERTLGMAAASVTPECLVAAGKRLIDVHRGAVDTDDRDSLEFKVFHGVDDFLRERVRLSARELRPKISMKLESSAGDVRRAIPSGVFTRSVKRFLTESALSSAPMQINPMELLDQASKVTSLGEGAISNERAIPLDARNLHPTHFGVIDPARTPESFKAGIDVRTTLSARRDDAGRLYTRVTDTKTGKPVDLTPRELQQATVAFPGEDLSSGLVDAMRDGRVSRVSVADVTHQVPHVASMYGPTTGMLPFLNGMQGNRIIMASKHLSQALPLVHREQPLVQVQSWRPGRTVEQEMADLSVPTSPVDGTIEKIDADYIYVRPHNKKEAAAEVTGLPSKTLDGHSFTIDRAKGTQNPKGTFTYPVDYGFVPGHTGEDGEDLDVFIGNDPKGHFSSFTKLKKNPAGAMVPDETKFLLGLSPAELSAVHAFFTPEWRQDERTYRDMAHAHSAFAPFKKTAAAVVNDGLVRLHYDSHFPLAAKTYLHNDIRVKEGDKVTAGQQLAESNFTRNGAMALGRNLSVGYMAYRGLNSNDGIVISQGAADKLASVHMYKTVQLLDDGSRIDKEAHRVYFGTRYTAAQYGKLDKDGVVTSGTTVLPGDLLLVGVRKTATVGNAALLGQLSRALTKPYAEVVQTWEHAHPGEVVDVVRSSDRVTVTVKTIETLNEGDKISGRFGNKGVIAKIIPDHHMVQDEAGNPIDVLYTSAGVISRINPAQIVEAAVGKVAAKTGKPIAVENFAKGNNVAFARKLLADNGLKDKETVFDPQSGKHVPGVFVGKSYILKIFKTTDSNWASHGVGPYDTNEQPAHGGTAGAKAIGKMEFDGLVAHNARNILREAASTKNQHSDEFWRSVQLGLPTPSPKPAFAYDKFLAMLRGAGVNVDKKGSLLTLGPVTDADVTRTSGGAIKNAKMVRARDLRPETGGLFDPGTTGGETGTKWSHIDLHEPVLNPVFEEPVRRLLGLTQKQLVDLHANRGGGHVRSMLADINVDERLTELRADTQRLNGAALDGAVKQVKYLEALKKQGLTPDKAYTLSKIPVIPPVFRPIVPQRDGRLLVGDANLLYRDAILANEQLKESKPLLPESSLGPMRAHLYDAVSAVFGTGDPVSPSAEKRGAKGFITRVVGTNPGNGFFQGSLMKRLQDVSGRATIAPDPSLDIDEIGMPEDMLWGMYEKFVIGRLIRKGYPALDAQKLVRDHAPLAREELLAEARERPVIVNRAPSLHRFNIIAAKPKIIAGKTVRLNPFAEKGMNADYDGDAVQIHAPVSHAGVNEAQRMMLSSLIFSDKRSAPLNVAPEMESVIGLHRATQPALAGLETKKFPDLRAARQAYQRGEIELRQPVDLERDPSMDEVQDV